ncbi:LOW QUALITY PROTEIN: coiled-coil domain-containing protein 42-like [Pithys albifrons albifrons]|uniref:LOW QUALITY PROTEIN: coiled-coil domain-containing protein 42-like n=1 Tax=Pithys albifrons albifrons TaxID=3385563 RepID=UPI003A5CC513
MDTWSNEQMMADYFLTLYRVELPHLLRELSVTEDESQSQSSFLHLLQTKKEAQQVEKALAETDEKNEEERILALRINSKEKEANMQKESELLRAKMELEALKKEHWKLCKKVQKYSIFKKYLEDVVKISQFENIPEVTSWYKLLVRTHKDLLQSQEGHKEMTEQDKVLLEQYRAEKEAEMLQYKSELVQLELCFDQAQSDVLLWETYWADIQNRTSKRTRKLWTIKLAIHNLFQSTNMWLNAEWNVSVDDSLRQLDMVKPSQSPSLPRNRSRNDSQLPKGSGKPTGPTDTFLFTWALSWAWRMGRGYQANLSLLRRQSKIKQFIQHFKDIQLYWEQEEASAEAKSDLACPDSEGSVGWEGKEENSTDTAD